MAKTKTTKPGLTYRQVETLFATDDACKAMLAKLRWPNGIRCPRCASEKVYRAGEDFRWKCKSCNKNGYRFTVITGTIFENTNVPLPIWFRVGFLMVSSKKGISALQVHRMIDPVRGSKGSYRTAWYMCHRIRAAMKHGGGPLGGIVEVDESYIGGKDRNRHKGKKSADMRKAAGRESGSPALPGEAVGYGKVGVIGAIARKGNVVASVIGDMDARTKSDFVRRVVSDDVKLLATDKDHAYNYVRRGLPHESVDHGAGEYVRGQVHTNTIESFWSLMKRGVMGSFHNVSKDYLPLYLNEFSWRFNHRNDPNIFEALLA